MNTTPLDRAIDIAATLQGVASGIGHIAQACGTSRQFVNKMRRQWRVSGCPPRALREYAPLIERAVAGRVLADELCPDVAWTRGPDGGVTSYSVTVRGGDTPAANDDSAATAEVG